MRETPDGLVLHELLEYPPPPDGDEGKQPQAPEKEAGQVSTATLLSFGGVAVFTAIMTWLIIIWWQGRPQ